MNALGVWTSADCALVLIDFQREMFQSIRSETGVDLVELHVRLLAKTAKAFCLTFASVQALQDGYDVMYVADAVGGRSQVAHSIAIARLAHAGAVPATALAVLTELFRDWRSPLAKNALEVIEWYFTEVPKVSKAIGVDVREKGKTGASS